MYQKPVINRLKAPIWMSQANFESRACPPDDLHPSLPARECISSKGTMTISSARRPPTVARSAYFRAVGLNEFDISQSKSSVKTAERLNARENAKACVLLVKLVPLGAFEAPCSRPTIGEVGRLNDARSEAGLATSAEIFV